MAVYETVHQPVPQGFQWIAAKRRRFHATAAELAVAQRCECGYRNFSRTCESGICRGREINVELVHVKVGGACGIQLHHEIGSTRGRRRSPVQVRRQHAKLGRTPLEALNRSGGASEHLGAIRRADVRAYKSGSSEVEIVEGEVVSIRPYAHLRIVRKIGERKRVSTVGAGCVGRLRYSNTLKIIASVVDGELGSDPTLSSRVKSDDGVAAVVALARPAESGPECISGKRTQHGVPALVEDLVFEVDVLDVLRCTRRPVVIRGHAVTEKGVAKTGTFKFKAEVRGLKARRILLPLQHRVR